MSAARQTLQQQTTASSGIPNFNSLLYRGAQTATFGQVAARQIRTAAGLVKIQSDLETFFSRDFSGPPGAPGPQGEAGITNINYQEDALIEYPAFTVQHIASQWTTSDSSDRQNDLSTNFGFVPLSGQFTSIDSTQAYPFYHSSAAYFIPMETNFYTTSVSVSNIDLPNFVEVPFHSDRIVKNISWLCPAGIALRFIIVGKPTTSGSNYVSKYYQIQGDKLFEEIPVGNSIITTQQANTSGTSSYEIPQANSKMPRMRSLAVIIYDVRYIPSSQRSSYNGNIINLQRTTSVPTDELNILTKGISIKCACANYVSSQSYTKQMTTNLTSFYYISRPNDTTLVNTTIQLPLINLLSNNSIELVGDNRYFQFNSPLPSLTNITLYANWLDTSTNPNTVQANTSITSIVPNQVYTNGTIMIEHGQNSGLVATNYPILYSVELSNTTTALMNLTVTIENDKSIYSVLDRLTNVVNETQILKTEANRILNDRFQQITPALLRFHMMPKNYHTETLTNSSIIRIDTEWNQQTGKYTSLIESTNASAESSHKTVRIVLPLNAPIDQTFPLVIYRKLPNELLPNIDVGYMNSSSTFVKTQSFITKQLLSPNLPSITAGSSTYHIDVKAFQFDAVTEQWKLISRKPQARTILKHLIIDKDSHIQKHFLVNDNQVQFSFNGKQLQALSAKGSQIKYITAKHYFSEVQNVDSTQRIRPVRYFSLNRDSIIQSMTGQELFEDMIGSGDVLRQTNITTLFDSDLTNLSQQDSQIVVSEFGNTTVTYGSQALLLNSKHEWTQESPLYWSQAVQSDNNLTLFSPYTGLSNDTQVLNQSFIFHIKVDKESEILQNLTVLQSNLYVPKVSGSGSLDQNLTVSFLIQNNATNSTEFNLISRVTNPVNATIAESSLCVGLDVDKWLRVGIDLSLVFSDALTTMQNIYARSAVYEIPNTSVLDGSQKVLLSTKVYPSDSSLYGESNLTDTGVTLTNYSTIDVDNVVIFNGIGDIDNPDISDNATIYLDELEIYIGAPIFTSVLGGSIVANPYH